MADSGSVLIREARRVGRTLEACETKPMQDYPEFDGRTAREIEMESVAESNAPPQMVRAQREWDSEAAKVAAPNYGAEEPVGTYTPE